MKSIDFLNTLIEQTHQLTEQIAALQTEELEILTWRETDHSWSILECIEHLNLYGDYYLPQIERRICTSTTIPAHKFKSGWLGGYFAKSMLPSHKLNKMSTFKDKNPLQKPLDKACIIRFLAQHSTLLELLVKSKQVDIGKIRIPTSISVWIRLKLGDTLQFYVNHMIRHQAQIQTILRKQGLEVSKISQ